jgi:hypothetical protein
MERYYTFEGQCLSTFLTQQICVIPTQHDFRMTVGWHSSRRPRFDAKPFHLVFVVDQEALQWGLLAVLRFSLPTIIHISFTFFCL